jgi:hypothetical protein
MSHGLFFKQYRLINYRWNKCIFVET